MTKESSLKWKLIKDLRIYYDESFKSELETLSPQIQHLFRRKAHIISQRFAAKLIELELNLPVYDHIFVFLSSDMQPGSFQYVSNVRDWNQHIHVGVSFVDLLKEQNDSRDIQLLKLVSESLLELARVTGFDREKVIEAYDSLLQHGEDLQIIHKTYKSKSLDAIVSYSVGDQTKLFLTWTIPETNQQGCVEVASINESRDVPHLISKISVSGSIIKLFPKKSERSQALLRTDYPGLVLPIEVDTASKTVKGRQQA